MIQPRDSLFDTPHGRAVRSRGPAEHEDRNSQFTGGGNFAVSRLAAAVLRHDGVNGEGLEEIAIAGMSKGAPRENVLRVGHFQGRFHGIDAANEIVMLGSRIERSQLLPPDGEENAPRFLPQGRDGIERVSHIDPDIPFFSHPRRPAQRKKRRTSLSSRGHCIGRNHRGVWVRGIDQHVHVLIPQVVRETVSSAKPAAPDRQRLGCRCGGSAGQRDRRPKLPARERPSELACFGRSAKNQNVWAHVDQP